MVKKCLREVLLIVTFTAMLFIGASCFAARPQGWSALYAVGNNLTPNGSIRVGYNDWEFGKLHHWAYGAIKNFYFADSYYTALGLALMPAQSGTAFGFVAGVGANWELFWGLSLRLEATANVNSNANLFQQGILGVGYDF